MSPKEITTNIFYTIKNTWYEVKLRSMLPRQKTTSSKILMRPDAT